MKKTTILCVLALASLTLALTFTSCAALDKYLLAPPTQVITPTVTNAVTGIVTPEITNAVYVPAPAPQAAASFISTLPLPYAAPVGIGLGWLLTAYANMRNKKLSSALVTGIEAGRKILQETPEGQALDAKIKDLLIQHQDIAGVLNKASALVNDLTANTAKQ
jgi:hypothetical protein